MKLLPFLALLWLAACAATTTPVAPILEPLPGARVWPAPPEAARYAYAGQLVGEKDFVGEQPTRDTLLGVLRWVAGLIIGPPTYIELQRPVSGMSDENGRILVVDAGAKAVIVFDMKERRVLRWKQATPIIEFAAPVAICGDGRGGFLVTDSELREVFRLDAAGKPIGRFGHAVLARPTGIARDSGDGSIYVADTAQHQIMVFDAGEQLRTTIGRRGSDSGEFNFPTLLAFANQELYVADTLNFRVQVIDRGGNDRLVFGEIGLYIGNMTRPKGVSVGRDGRIYVIESYFDHLLVFDRKGELLLPIGGEGRDIGEFYLPSGVWTDALGRVYVADMFNGRVVVFKELGAEEEPI